MGPNQPSCWKRLRVLTQCTWSTLRMASSSQTTFWPSPLTTRSPLWSTTTRARDGAPFSNLAPRSSISPRRLDGCCRYRERRATKSWSGCSGRAQGSARRSGNSGITSARSTMERRRANASPLKQGDWPRSWSDPSTYALTLPANTRSPTSRYSWMHAVMPTLVRHGSPPIPNVHGWLRNIAARPAVRRGLRAPKLRVQTQN
jgi:hypothetical protein